MLPEETENLFRVVALKQRLKALRVHKLERGKDTFVLSFLNDTPVTPEHLLTFLDQITSKKSRVSAKITPDSRLVVNAPLVSTETIFTFIDDIVHKLQSLSHAK